MAILTDSKSKEYNYLSNTHTPDPGDKGLCMKGKVKTREKCPKCGNSFLSIPERDIFCPDCNTHPQTFFIFLYHQKNKYRISRDTDGKILDSYKRAHRLLENIRKDIDDGIFLINDYLPKEVQQYRGHILLDKWIHTKKDLSPKHKKEVERLTGTYYLPFLKAMDCRYIRTHHIEDFYLSLPDTLSSKTKKNIIIMLKNFCNWLFRTEILLRMPQFPSIDVEEKPIEWITKEDQFKILHQIKECHKPIFSFMMYHPVRPGEARALKVKDFDTENMIVLISKTWSLDEIRQRKGKKPYYLPISAHFDLSLLDNKLPDAFVFTNEHGRPYIDSYLKKIWHKAREKAGVPYIKLYAGLRHSIASQAVNSGVGLDIVSKALGHSTSEMTKKYASLNTNMLKSVVDGAQMVHIEEIKDRKPLKNKG